MKYTLSKSLSDQVLEDYKKTRHYNLDSLSFMSGLVVTRYSVKGTLELGLGHIESIISDFEPPYPGWTTQFSHFDQWIPNRRIPEGRRLSGLMHSLDGLGMYSALERAGIPYYISKLPGSGHLKYNFTGDKLIEIETPKKWPNLLDFVEGLRVDTQYHIDIA